MKTIEVAKDNLIERLTTDDPTREQVRQTLQDLINESDNLELKICYSKLWEWSKRDYY